MENETSRNKPGKVRRTHVKNGMVGEGRGFERTRRITGYLVGDLDRFGDAKRAEERDRIKHGFDDPEETAAPAAPRM